MHIRPQKKFCSVNDSTVVSYVMTIFYLNYPQSSASRHSEELQMKIYETDQEQKMRWKMSRLLAKV